MTPRGLVRGRAPAQWRVRSTKADDQRPRTRPPLLRSFRYGVSGGTLSQPDRGNVAARKPGRIAFVADEASGQVRPPDGHRRGDTMSRPEASSETYRLGGLAGCQARRLALVVERTVGMLGTSWVEAPQRVALLGGWTAVRAGPRRTAGQGKVGGRPLPSNWREDREPITPRARKCSGAVSRFVRSADKAPAKTARQATTAPATFGAVPCPP